MSTRSFSRDLTSSSITARRISSQLYCSPQVRFGGDCVAAECYKAGGEPCFLAYKNRLIAEFNALGIADMPTVTTLCQLCGGYINSEYTLPNGSRIKLLDDSKIYLGYQIEKANSDRCYGLAADDQYLLVCEYGCNGSDPEIIVYKKR